MLVNSFLEHSALTHAERVALVCGSRRLSYREIETAATRFAAGLRRGGVQRGDRVVIQMENGAEAVFAIFGALKAGAVFVPVGPTVKADKLKYIVDDAGATALVTDQPFDGVDSTRRQVSSLRLTAVNGDLPDVRPSGVVSVDDWLDAPVETLDPGLPVIDLDLAALMYTSGSTGQPKGVMLSHANIVAAVTSIGDYLQNTEDDIILDVLPLSFDYGLYQVFLAFKAGARLVLERSFAYPSLTLELMERERVTGLPIVPTLMSLLLRHDLRSFDLSLRYVTNTGAVLPPAHIAAFRKALPHVRLFSMYGLTECKRVSFLSPDEIDERPASVGKPMDNVEVYVADEEGRLSETGVGELVIRGANVMQGYWRNPEETSRVLTSGPFPGPPLLRSGDRFRIDAEGYMYFEGRLDELIKSRGQRVSPKEVENVLFELEGVVGAMVVGIEDALLGTAIKAYVCVDPAVTVSEMDVRRHCACRLEDFMVPKFVEFVGALPTTDSGKVTRRGMAATQVAAHG